MYDSRIIIIIIIIIIFFIIIIIIIQQKEGCLCAQEYSAFSILLYCNRFVYTNMFVETVSQNMTYIFKHKNRNLSSLVGYHMFLHIQICLRE
jgi:hypothetical protein